MRRRVWSAQRLHPTGQVRGVVMYSHFRFVMAPDLPIGAEISERDATAIEFIHRIDGISRYAERGYDEA